MATICIISNNHLPEKFWKQHFENDQILKVSQHTFTKPQLHIDIANTVIIDDYFTGTKTAVDQLEAIATHFAEASIFHLSPEHVFGTTLPTLIKPYSFSAVFLHEVRKSLAF